jgi:ribosome-associated translation inhibitor RaiA
VDLVVKGRGGRVSGQALLRLERKLDRLSRLDPRLGRVEVEVIREPSARVGGGHRVEALCRSGRKTYRAAANGPDVEAAFVRVLGRLERQIAEAHGKRRTRMLDGANRVKSDRMSRQSELPAPPPE